MSKGKLNDRQLAYLDGMGAGIEQGRKELAEPSAELLEIGRKAIEDVLIEWRDDRLSMLGRANGLVIKEKDGGDSSIIRFGPEMALKIGLKAMAQSFKKVKK